MSTIGAAMQEQDLPIAGQLQNHGVSARRRVIYAAFAGLAVGLVCLTAGLHFMAVLTGWVGLAFVYLLMTWRHIVNLDAQETAEWAVAEDPTRPLSDAVLLVSAIVSIAAVGFVMANAARLNGAARLAEVLLSLGTLVLSWAVVHTVYMLRYARLYYTGKDGGINFNQEMPPRYLDFAYVAFTIGMTFQVSDTNITSSMVRRAALTHALLSYLFGAVILATAVNLVASIV